MRQENLRQSDAVRLRILTHQLRTAVQQDRQCGRVLPTLDPEDLSEFQDKVWYKILTCRCEQLYCYLLKWIFGYGEEDWLNFAEFARQFEINRITVGRTLWPRAVPHFVETTRLVTLEY